MANENTPDILSEMLPSQHKHQASCLPQISRVVRACWLTVKAGRGAPEAQKSHLLCSMWHPCVLGDNAERSRVGADPWWDFLELHLNKFLLPSTFDGVSNPTITGFF